MKRRLVIRYGVAFVSVAVTALLVLLASPLGPMGAQIFLAAVMVSAWYGGLGPGLMATILACLAFLPPAHFAWTRAHDAVGLAVFVLMASLINYFSATRRRLEHNVRQRDDRINKFLATFAHELRTPLSTLMNALELLDVRRNDPKAVVDIHHLMERQTRHVNRLVNDLLDVSRIDQGKLFMQMEVVDLVTVVHDAVEVAHPLMEERRQRLEVTMPRNGLIMKGDPTRLKQVVVNLLMNAAQYTAPGGWIRIDGQRLPGEIILRVRDNGMGLSAELLPRVFELYVQAANGTVGLGIGLNLVRAIVAMHGGAVSAASRGPNQGSEFVIRLPDCQLASVTQVEQMLNKAATPCGSPLHPPAQGIGSPLV